MVRKLLVIPAALGLVALSPFASSARSHPQLTYPACPRSDRQLLTSTAKGAGHKLVPGHPRSVLTCRYKGLNPVPADSTKLAAHRLVRDRSTVRTLRREFDALSPMPSGVFNCPADQGVEIIAIFRYGTARADDPVTLDPGGCTPVTNGHISRTAAFPPGRALITKLERLTRAN